MRTQGYVLFLVLYIDDINLFLATEIKSIYITFFDTFSFYSGDAA